jgi:hypothetical protein
LTFNSLCAIIKIMSSPEEISKNQAPTFANAPHSVLHAYLNRAPIPSEGSIDTVSRIIEDTYSQGRRDAFGLCLDLTPRVTDSTLVLAEMFGKNHPGLPDHWKSNPEIMRSVLSMSGYAELGVLQAQRVHLQGQGYDVTSLDEKVHALERLTAELQEQ